MKSWNRFKPEYFKQVLDLVTEGFTIRQACSKLKIESTTLYNNLTSEQKKVIQNSKLLQQGGHTYFRVEDISTNADADEFFRSPKYIEEQTIDYFDLNSIQCHSLLF